LRWLDDITSLPEDAPHGNVAGLVHLQGGYETYEHWAQVEEFLLPETLLSMETEAHDTDSMEDSLADLNIDAVPDHASACSQDSIDVRTSSPLSAYSATSPALRTASPYTESKVIQPIGTGRPSHKKTNSNVSLTSTESSGKKSKRTVPIALRPFFNYILWRIHQEENAAAAMESFLLITNDQLKVQIAQRFGIRVKRLEQMREIVAREERDTKNRAELLKKELEAEAKSEARLDIHLATPQSDPDDEEDEVVLKRTPPKAPQAMTNGRVWDPNAFGRATQSPGRGPRGAFRGRAGSVRGNYAPRGVSSPSPRTPPVDLTKPIDPDSFNRASAANRVARGGRRRLWEPA
jgi:hypothetical protein